jgi:hypothetical protein
MEDILAPGMSVVYDGSKASTITHLTLGYPTITPSRYYRLQLQSKNCGQVYSTPVFLTVASASVPAQIVNAPFVVSYDDATTFTIGWSDPPSSGGFAVLDYTVYRDNANYATIDASQNIAVITGVLGTEYKMQISATNEVGESLKSPSARITFANRPDPPASLTLSSNTTPSIEAKWTAPVDSKGDLPSGYRLYVDNGAGGQYEMVFDGSSDMPATFSFVVSQNILCGGRYSVKVTAVNVAGESDGTVKEITVGEPPSPPLYPRLTVIVPSSSLTIKWDPVLSDGCRPVTRHVITRDNVDLADVVAPEAVLFDDDISSYAMGSIITYKIRAVNDQGDGELSVPLFVTVGQAPNAPSGIFVSRRMSETQVEL